MAEKSTELEKADDLDPVSTAAGAEHYEGTDSYELSSDETPEETEQLKAQIEQTRSQMGETIDAIQDRLSVANISEQVSERVNNAIETAKDTAYDATIGKAAETSQYPEERTSTETPKVVASEIGPGQWRLEGEPERSGTIGHSG